jgi:ElaB/YqjD/DUF883 family membrane-anchored ribosome-binding protein
MVKKEEVTIMGFLKKLLGIGVTAGATVAAVKVAEQVKENNPDGVQDVNGDGKVDVKDYFEEVKKAATEVYQDAASAIKEKAPVFTQKAKDAAEDVKGVVNDAAETVKEKAPEYVQKAKDAVTDAAATVKEKAPEYAEKAKEAVLNAKDAVVNALDKKDDAPKA